MITGVFVSPDGRDVAIEYEGGLLRFEVATGEPFDLEGVPSDWRRWEPAPVVVEGVDLGESVPVYEHDQGYPEAGGL